jgi:hypothetical protein
MDLADKIARAIFSLGDVHGSPCKRIQFLAGEYPDNERAQGGMGEKPLADFIRNYLLVQEAQRQEELWWNKKE